jgi:hypothetical protein
VVLKVERASCNWLLQFKNNKNLKIKFTHIFLSENFKLWVICHKNIINRHIDSFTQKKVFSLIIAITIRYASISFFVIYFSPLSLYHHKKHTFNSHHRSQLLTLIENLRLKIKLIDWVFFSCLLWLYTKVWITCCKTL